jgi:hypothetical protein
VTNGSPYHAGGGKWGPFSYYEKFWIGFVAFWIVVGILDGVIQWIF